MRHDLSWGPEVIDHLLPHRAPFRLVDRVHHFEPARSLLTSKLISSNEPVFQGHFPDLALWPGVYTLEGLAQSCNLFLGLQALVDASDWPSVRRQLGGLSARRRLKPVPSSLKEPEHPGVSGFIAGAEIKWRHPVFAGDVLDYRIADPTQALGMVVLQVEATVKGERVADGRLTVAPRQR